MLVRAYLAGKPWAWEEVKGWITPVVNKADWCFGCDRQDTIHECLVAIHASLPGFRGGCQLKTYVCRIAYNICINHLREYIRRKKIIAIEEIVITADSLDPPGQLIREEKERLAAKDIETILASASSRCLDLWRMHYWQRLTYEVIARKLGVALNTVKVRAYRCKEKARKGLGLEPTGDNH